jgi:hypothetical protein
MNQHVKIIAIAPSSVWAFIENDGKIYLLQPPYFDQIEVTERDIEKLLQLYSFVEYDKDFADLGEAIELLETQYVELLEKLGIENPSTEELKELLNYADDETLLEYLQRAKDELIPDGDFDTALTVVKDIIKLKRTNPEINSKAESIWQEVLDKKDEVLKSIQNTMQTRQQSFEQSLTDIFPNALRKYSLEDIIKQQNQVSTEKEFLNIAA